MLSGLAGTGEETMMAAQWEPSWGAGCSQAELGAVPSVSLLLTLNSSSRASVRPTLPSSLRSSVPGHEAPVTQSKQDL